jgi:lysophospholipase L1-like esterase
VRRAALLAAAVVAALALAAAGAAAGTQRYYLALGDSLAAGVQPDASGASVPTGQGYASDLYALYRLRAPGLRYENLACPGETTGTMLHGGIPYCAYPLGSQLAQAVTFLQTHRVALVTLDIGANDVDSCVGAAGVDVACVGGGLAAASAELPQILTALRAAAGPAVPIVAMSYYDPFLAAWLQGPAGQLLAQQSVQAATQFNQLLGGIYARFGVPVADVAGAFRTTDSTPLPLVGTPVDVAAVCALTWMCAPAPRGPNIHANAVGYGVVAATFARTIGRLPGR